MGRNNKAGQGADDRADDRQTAGTHTLRTQGGGQKVHDHRQRRQHAEHGQGDPTDLLETADPCRQQHAGEGQGKARKYWEDDPDCANQHHQRRQDVQNGL